MTLLTSRKTQCLAFGSCVIVLLCNPATLWAQAAGQNAVDTVSNGDIWFENTYPTSILESGQSDAPQSSLAGTRPVKLAQRDNIEQSVRPDLTAQSDFNAVNNGDEDGLFVSSIAIQGADTLPLETFSTILEDNIGEMMDEEDLRRITQQIADLARERGFVLATARVPEQAVEHGILTVEIDEGRIDEVRIKGSDNSALRAILSTLEGGVASKKQIERRLVLAGDIPEINVRRTQFITEDGRNILLVNVREAGDRVRLRLDNYGSQRIGPVRARLSYSFRGFLDDSDIGSVSVRTNPIDPSEFVFGSASYSTGIGVQGTRLGVAGSYGTNQPGDGFSNIEGDSRYVEIFAEHPLIRTNDASLWINGNVAYLSVEQDDVIGLLRQDNQVTFSLGLSSNVKFLKGRLRAGTTFVQGLDLFDATREGDFFASRFDGDGVFTSGEFFANWSGRLAGKLGLYLGVNGQISNRPLLATQEFTIGGAFSARGFDFSEVSGENGFAALVELNYTIRKPANWLDRLQPYVFVDGGYVDNLENGFGSGTLVSSGAGVRANAGRFNLEVEGAVPLNRDRDESGDQSPHINLRVGLDL